MEPLVLAEKGAMVFLVPLRSVFSPDFRTFAAATPL
jgi:hypothetical protein